MTELLIGSRGSVLALAQTKWVADRIRLHSPEVETRVEIIKTKGDKILDTPLAKIGDKGLFVREIEVALAEGKIDLAVHSLKDLPSEMTDGLTIAATPARVDPSDTLLSKRGGLSDLPAGAKVGTSSLRRKAQLMAFRPDLVFEDLRGNLDTRIRRLQAGDFDAIVLAKAGLHRLKWDAKGAFDAKLLVEMLPFEICLPAVGQGALGVQVRTGDDRTVGIVRRLNDELTEAAVTAERALLAALGGGCQAPIAALAIPKSGNIELDALVAALNGKNIVRVKQTDKMTNAAALGEKTAQVLLESGAREILEDVRKQSAAMGMGAA